MRCVTFDKSPSHHSEAVANVMSGHPTTAALNSWIYDPPLCPCHLVLAISPSTHTIRPPRLPIEPLPRKNFAIHSKGKGHDNRWALVTSSKPDRHPRRIVVRAVDDAVYFPLHVVWRRSPWWRCAFTGANKRRPHFSVFDMRIPGCDWLPVRHRMLICFELLTLLSYTNSKTHSDVIRSLHIYGTHKTG